MDKQIIRKLGDNLQDRYSTLVAAANELGQTDPVQGGLWRKQFCAHVAKKYSSGPGMLELETRQVYSYLSYYKNDQLVKLRTACIGEATVQPPAQASKKLQRLEIWRQKYMSAIDRLAPESRNIDNVVCAIGLLPYVVKSFLLTNPDIAGRLNDGERLFRQFK